MKHVLRFFLALIISHSFLFSQPVVPEWAKNAIWYQIFPERFRNGDTTNDPTPLDLELPPQREWHISPWTSDWYALQPWEVKHSRNFYDNVFERRYGGDLQGVLDELDYLSELGITAIYFNPVFEAISLHKYDASTYHHIDHTFGPDARGDLELIKGETDDPSTWKWTAADSLFLRLVKEAHRRGIKVIIDGVFNHCGTRFWAFQDVIKNQQRSRYADWFEIKRWDNPATPQDEFDYKGWWDIKELPEFREDANGFVKPVREYFFNITRRWMDPNGDGDPSEGVDGWRLDVANEVSHVFWKEWRKLVKSINPNAYIVGEIWDDASNWLKGDEFDAVMNYRFARAVVRFFIDTDSRIYTATEFDRELAEIRKEYPGDVNYVLQNLIDSHDTDRLGSMIMNPNRKYDDQNGLRSNPEYDVSKPTPPARRIQKLIVLFQMTYLGAPMIYYGDESGMWGADDPDDRKPMVWPDFTYENEKTHPIPGRTRTNDVVRFDEDLFNYYRKLVRIRKENAALSTGDFTALLTDDTRGIYVFRRMLGDDETIVALNNSGRKDHVDSKIDGFRVYRELLSGNEIVGKDHLQLVLEPKSGLILQRIR